MDSARFVLEIFGGLLTLDQDLNLIADLAEAVPEPQFNADGSVTYRFALRRDALFHNERRVQAADVKGSLERAAAPETFSRTAPDFLNDIVGMQAFNRGLTDGIEGIQVIDERTIEITIDAPKPYFLFKTGAPRRVRGGPAADRSGPDQLGGPPQRHRPLPPGPVGPSGAGSSSSRSIATIWARPRWRRCRSASRGVG